MSVTYHNPQWGAERPIRGVLFDMDGLVLDSEVLFTRFWREAANALGYPMTVEQSYGMRSLGKALGQPYLESLFGPGIDYTTVRNKRIGLMSAYVAEHGIAPKPGIYELLDYLEEAGIPAAIASSSPMDAIEKHLAAVNLKHRFQKLCSAHSIQARPGYLPSGCLRIGPDPGIMSGPGGFSHRHPGSLPGRMPPRYDPGSGSAR